MEQRHGSHAAAPFERENNHPFTSVTHERPQPDSNTSAHFAGGVAKQAKKKKNEKKEREAESRRRVAHDLV